MQGDQITAGTLETMMEEEEYDQNTVGARLFNVVDFMPDPTPDTEEVPYEIRLALWRIFNIVDLDHNGTLDASEVHETGEGSTSTVVFLSIPSKSDSPNNVFHPHGQLMTVLEDEDALADIGIEAPVHLTREMVQDIINVLSPE